MKRDSISIMIGRGNSKPHDVEISLPPSHRPGDPSEPIKGRLLGVVTKEQIAPFLGQDVSVAFEGRRYRFSHLESDGSFEIVKDW